MSFNKVSIIALTVISAFGMSGCKQAQQKEAAGVLDFPVTETKQWTKITTDELLPIPADFVAADSSIYLLGYMDGHWLHEVDKNNPMAVKSSINRGQGPDDMINAISMAAGHDGAQLTTFDLGPMALKVYNQESNAGRQYDLKALNTIIRNAWPISDSRCLIFSLTPQENGVPVRTYLLADLDSMRITGRCDTVAEPLKEYLPALMMQSDMAMSPDGKHFAVGTTIGGILEFFTVTDSEIIPKFSEVVFPSKTENKDGVSAIPENPVYGFTAMCATDELVYGAFAGTTDPDSATNIGVWKWSGEPVKLIQTDATILKLDIDKSGKELYGVIYSEESGPQVAGLPL